MSEGSKNSRSFEDSGRSDEEDSKDGAFSEDGGSETPQVRKSTRESRAPVMYSPSANYLLLTKNGEPFLFRSLEVKEEQDGNKRYKARLVVKGFQQKRGVKYNEIFSLVVKMTTIRLVLSIVASEDLHLEQLDVKIAFLHGDLNEDIYMTQSEGFQSAGKKENLKCRLKKIMYGLIQVPRLRYLKFDTFMQKDKNEEPCRDVHQVGDEREVEVLRNFKWPPSELITKDVVLPERGYS
ncbi:putative RNA-directed DNA polymerase [Tanacetum coccineum]